MTWPPGSARLVRVCRLSSIRCGYVHFAAGDEPEEPPTATHQRAEDQSPPRFHQRAAAEVAAQAGLGEHGAAQVERVQDFYRQIFEYHKIFELVDDEAWPNIPVGPLGDQWRGVGGAQSTYYLINVATVICELMRTLHRVWAGRSHNGSRRAPTVR